MEEKIVSTRELIQGIKNEALNSATLTPPRAAELVTMCAALFGNCLDELRAREAVYKTILLQCYELEKTANRAKLKAENDPSYMLFREAQDTKVLCLELLRSIKAYLRESEQELRYSGNQ